jgi:hypothetical protein
MVDPRNCTTLIHVDHILFKPADGKCESAHFEVGTAPAIITAYELSPGACAHVEMIGGCGSGEYFTKLMKNCGCAAGLNEGNNQLVVSMPGRYRLVWCDCDTDEGYVEIRFKAVSAQLTESSMGNSCCGTAAVVPALVSTSTCIAVNSTNPAVTTIGLDLACLCTALTPCFQALIPPSAAAHNPATIVSGNAAVTVGGGGASQAFTIGFNPVEAASDMAGAPTAVSILCAALKPCIQALIPAAGASTVVVGDSPITATPIPGGYKIGIDPAYTPHAPAAITSPDGVLTVGVSGPDNQNFSLAMDCAALKAKCGYLTIADTAALCAWISSLPLVGPLQP